MSIEDRIESEYQRIETVKGANVYCFGQSVSEVRSDGTVLVDGKPKMMMGSYSYLGLIHHPKISQSAIEAVSRYGTGTHGVRLLAGSLDLHYALEKRVAAFKKTEDAICYSSGYQTNLAAIGALVGPRDVVINDQYNHASIMDGSRLSGAKNVRFRHNDMAALEKKLAASRDAESRLVITDSVFSMDGDVCNLPDIRALCDKYDAWLMVDEAHSIGVLGETGHGIEEHFKMPGSVDISMGTFSKTIPSVGGYIASNAKLINLLRHRSRGYIFSAALPPAQAAAAMTALDVIDSSPDLVKTAQKNGAYFRDCLKKAGFNTLNTETPIVPVIVGEDDKAMAMAAALNKEGIFALPVIFPAVSKGLARIRATTLASHTRDQIDQAVVAFIHAGKSLGVI